MPGLGEDIIGASGLTPFFKVANPDGMAICDAMEIPAALRGGGEG